MKTILLLILLLAALPAQAERAIRIKTVYYSGPGAISAAQAIYIQHKAAEWYRDEFHARTVVGKFRARVLPWPECQTIEAWKDYGCWNLVKADNMQRLKHGKLTLAIVPPLLVKGVQYFGGYGDLGSFGVRPGLAQIHCASQRGDGKPVDYACFLVAVHELGHNFNFSHCVDQGGCDGLPNFMHSNAGQWTDLWGWKPAVAYFTRFQWRLYHGR